MSHSSTSSGAGEAEQPSRRQPPNGDYVAWAQRVNDRWLVHQGLDTATARYFEHLAATDPERLKVVSKVAWQLIGQGGLRQDPKPLFYGAVYSLATPEEVQAYLSEHRFTCLASPSTEVLPYADFANGRPISEETYQKALDLRCVIKAALEETRKA